MKQVPREMKEARHMDGPLGGSIRHSPSRGQAGKSPYFTLTGWPTPQA